MAPAEDRLSLFDGHILEQILLRMPSKAVARLKCSSKKYRDLISELMVLQAERSIDNVLGIFHITHSGSGSLAYTPLHPRSCRQGPKPSVNLFSNHHEMITVMAACNGLMLYRLREDRHYFLGNLTTNSFRHLPRLAQYDAKFGLAFSPSMSQARIKVVACFPSFTPAGGVYNFALFSTVSNTWMVSDMKVPCIPSQLFATVNSVLFNGALHWLGEGDQILAFNVEEERAYTIALPDNLQARAIASYSNIWFGVVKGQMSLMLFSDRTICVWEMADYNNNMGRWELRGRIVVEGNGCYKKSVPVFYDGDKAVFLTWDQERWNCGMAVYRIGSRMWDQFRSLEGWMDRCRHFIPYISHMLGVIPDVVL